jgi:hypothetical protein
MPQGNQRLGYPACVATSTELRDWLVAAQTQELVRRTAHWMDEAIKDPDMGYRDDPGLAGDAVLDAIVAAAVEAVALKRGEDSPKWTSRPERFLNHFWYPGPPSLFAWALAHSPGPFQIRGILIEADSLASV